MRKRIMLPILIISIIIQLLVPVGMIIYGNNADAMLEKYGKEFKVPVSVQSIYEGSVDIRIYGYYWYETGSYVAVKESREADTDVLEEYGDTKPETDYYIRVTAENKKKLNSFEVDSDYTLWRITEESAYLIIKVYKGNFEVVNLYIDNIPAEEWVREKVTEDKMNVVFDENENLFG